MFNSSIVTLCRVTTTLPSRTGKIWNLYWLGSDRQAHAQRRRSRRRTAHSCRCVSFAVKRGASPSPCWSWWLSLVVFPTRRTEKSSTPTLVEEHRRTTHRTVHSNRSSLDRLFQSYSEDESPNSYHLLFYFAPDNGCGTDCFRYVRTYLQQL